MVVTRAATRAAQQRDEDDGAQPTISKKRKADSNLSEDRELRRSTRIRARKPLPPDTDSSRQASEEAPQTLASYDATYMPASPSTPGGSVVVVASWSTPQRPIDALTPRPPRQPLIDINPTGEVSILTGYDNQLKSLQDAHVVGRATAPNVEAGFRKVMVILVFNPDSRSNRILIEAEYHIALDNGLCAFFYDVKILRRLFRALSRKPIYPIDGSSRVAFKRNEDGFTHHEDVFPPGPFEARFVPLGSWTTRPLHCTHGSYDPPFVNLPKIPLICRPYFIVWQAYLALDKWDRKAPAHLKREAHLIVNCGNLMQSCM
ncbi:hypothetical protein HDZ31DRAFT_61958 [Schizophyllum fasciatum]